MGFLARYQVLVAVGAIAVLVAAWHMRYLLATLFASYVLASAMNIPVTWLTKHKVPRLLAIAIAYGSVLLILAGLLALAIVPLSIDVAGFANTFPAYLERFTSLIEEFGFGSIDTGTLLTAIQQEVLHISTNLASALSGIVLAVVASIYIVSDWKRIHDVLARALGPERRTDVQKFFDRTDQTVGLWVRGQIMLSVLVGILVYVGLTLIDIPFALVLALLAGVLEIIPFMGPIIAAVPALIIAFNVSAFDALLVLALYIAIQQIEGEVLAPQIMKRAVSLHPIVIIFGILAGYHVAGIAGALLAIPLISMIWIGISMARDRTGFLRHQTQDA